MIELLLCANSQILICLKCFSFQCRVGENVIGEYKVIRSILLCFSYGFVLLGFNMHWQFDDCILIEPVCWIVFLCDSFTYIGKSFFGNHCGLPLHSSSKLCCLQIFHVFAYVVCFIVVNGFSWQIFIF